MCGHILVEESSYCCFLVLIMHLLFVMEHAELTVILQISPVLLQVQDICSRSEQRFARRP